MNEPKDSHFTDQTLALLISLAEEYDPAPEGKTLTPNQAIIDFLNWHDVAEIFSAINEKITRLDSQPVPVEPDAIVRWRFIKEKTGGLEPKLVYVLEYIDTLQSELRRVTVERDNAEAVANGWKYDCETFRKRAEAAESELKKLREQTQHMFTPINPCSCVPDGDNGAVAHLCEWHKEKFGKAYRMQNIANSVTVKNFTKLPPDKLRLFIAHGIQESTARKAAESRNKRLVELLREPTIEVLTEMAYQLNVVPRGEPVGDWLQHMDRQYRAAFKALSAELLKEVGE